MRFMQKGILFLEVQIIVSLSLLGTVALIIYDNDLASALVVPLVLLLSVFILQLTSKKEYIIMDDEGIRCQMGRQLCWTFQWLEIAELRIGSRFRNPSVEIVIRPDCDAYSRSNETVEAYFQLGFTARRAIRRYCRCPITQIS